MSQVQLANAAGLTQATVSHYETAKREPMFVCALRIADALNVTLDELTKSGDEELVRAAHLVRMLGLDYEPDSICIGRRARELRQQRGLTQAQLAQAAGLNQGSLSALEAGRIDLKLRTALRLAVALDSNPHDFTPEPQPSTGVVRPTGSSRKTVGRRVLEWRLGRGLSPATLASWAGMPQVSLSNYEMGKGELSLASVLRLTAALDITLGDLLDTPDLIVMRNSRLGAALIASVQADPVLSTTEEWRSLGLT